jgi:hypothetical protein
MECQTVQAQAAHTSLMWLDVLEAALFTSTEQFLMFETKQYKFTLGKQSIPSTQFVQLKSTGRRKKNGEWHKIY